MRRKLNTSFLTRPRQMSTYLSPSRSGSPNCMIATVAAKIGMRCRLLQESWVRMRCRLRPGRRHFLLSGPWEQRYGPKQRLSIWISAALFLRSRPTRQHLRRPRISPSRPPEGSLDKAATECVSPVASTVRLVVLQDGAHTCPRHSCVTIFSAAPRVSEEGIRISPRSFARRERPPGGRAFRRRLFQIRASRRWQEPFPRHSP